MIFTIEPMLTAGDSACREWADDWTVVTVDGSIAAQFEVRSGFCRASNRRWLFLVADFLCRSQQHTVLITEDGVEILTLPE